MSYSVCFSSFTYLLPFVGKNITILVRRGKRLPRESLQNEKLRMKYCCAISVYFFLVRFLLVLFLILQGALLHLLFPYWSMKAVKVYHLVIRSQNRKKRMIPVTQSKVLLRLLYIYSDTMYQPFLYDY